MKKILALVLCLVLAFSTVSAVYANGLVVFSDVDVTSDVGVAILTLYVEGIVKGYGDGTFGVEKNLTRAEFARMINLVFGFAGSSENKFSDVKSGDWFYADVLTAIKAGYIAGFEDGTFRGNSNVTRQQVCSVVNRIIKAEDKKEHIKISDKIDSWAEKDVRAIVDNGYMKTEAGDVFRATENIKRGELALLLAQFVDDSEYTVDIPDIDDPVEPDKPVKPNNTVKPNKPDEPDDPDDPDIPTPDPKPDIPTPDPEPVDNTEVLAHLNKVISQLDGERFVGKEAKLIGYVKTAIKSTIEAGEAGEKLTDDYVYVHFGSEVSQVRSIYAGMTEDERDSLVMKISALDLDTLAYLQEYFLE